MPQGAIENEQISPQYNGFSLIVRHLTYLSHQDDMDANELNFLRQSHHIITIFRTPGDDLNKVASHISDLMNVAI